MAKVSKVSTNDLLDYLQKRFEANMHRHPQLKWVSIHNHVTSQPAIQKALAWMEDTGGEPDVVQLPHMKTWCFIDCASESPVGRRSLCYDDKALHSRKQNKPQGSALGWAQTHNLQLIDETTYRALQAIEPFDLKTSSWILTPDRIRNLGGALFCDRRYNSVFTYHNGAESYYASRGFRAVLQP